MEPRSRPPACRLRKPPNSEFYLKHCYRFSQYERLVDHEETLSDVSTVQLSILQTPDADGRGNVLFLCEDGPEALVLKAYRRRWSRWQDYSEALVSRLLLRTTGRCAGARWRTELSANRLWAQHGFDVFRIVDKPLPRNISPPATWFEYCPGRVLRDLIRDQDVFWEEKMVLLRRLGSEMGRRHSLAMELQEPLLIQKHGTLEHVMISDERMITFDLEGSFRPGFDLLEALAQELSGYLRSIAKTTGDLCENSFKALASGYEDQDLLKKVVDWGVNGKTLYRHFTRRQDRRRRPINGKVAALDLLHRLL